TQLQTVVARSGAEGAMYRVLPTYRCPEVVVARGQARQLALLAIPGGACQIAIEQTGKEFVAPDGLPGTATDQQLAAAMARGPFDGTCPHLGLKNRRHRLGLARHLV